MDENKDIKNDGLLIAVGNKNINLDVLEKEYMDATNKIFNKTKNAINRRDEFQENCRIVSNVYQGDFENFISALRKLKITLPNSVTVEYFQDNGAKEVINQIYKLNMPEEYQKHLDDKCWYYHNSANTLKENKIQASDLEPLRKHIKAEEVFTPRFKCLILICKDKMYSGIHDKAKKLLGQIVAELKKNGLIFNEKIKDEINKGIIEKYGTAVSRLYTINQSEINEIILEAAKIKNEHEVKTILKQLEYQDKIKAEKEQKKQKEQERQNNKPKDKSKTEKNDNNEEKNNNKKIDKKNNLDTKGKTQGSKENNKQNKSDKKSSSVQVKLNNENKNKNPEIKLEQQKEIEKPNKIDKQRIREVAESSYFQKMLYDYFQDYQNGIKQNTLETANTYTALRNLSLNFASLIKNNYLGNNGLSFPEYHQNQEIDKFLIQYLRDDKFNEFKFQNKPIQFKQYGCSITYSYYDEISAKAGEKSDNIAKTLIKEDFIFQIPEFQTKAGATGCSSTNNDCFIWALLSHISLKELEDIKKFVDKNRKCLVPVWNNNLELSKNNSGNVIRKRCDLFSYAGGTKPFIDDQAKTIAYVRAALAINIAKNQADKLETKENWKEFLTLLGCGPEKDANGNIINRAKRDVNGNGNMVAQAVVDLTHRPFLLIYNGVESGYLLRTTTHIADSDDAKIDFDLQLGDFSFNSIYSRYNNNSNLPSKSFQEAQKELRGVNQRLLRLIDDENVISVKLDASGNVLTGGTSGHFYAIGRNYTGETLTTQKNNDVFNKFNVERNLKSNSPLRKQFDQLGFAEKNKNMPSCYFLANGNNFQGLEDIINFLQTLDSKNIKANFDTWFKNVICNDDGKINEGSFVNWVIKLFYSPNQDQELFKDNNKVVYLREAINKFLSYVPSHFHSKWFRIINDTFSNPALFFKDTVIEKLEKIKLENDNGMKYFGYLIGKLIQSFENQQKLQEAYNKWNEKFIDSSYLENILTRKNDIENDFLSEVKENKFIGYNNQDVVNNLLKFIRLFDPSDLYVLIGVVKKEQNCDALKPLYNLSPKTVSKFFTLFREFVEKGKNQNEIKNDKNKLLGEINSQNPNGIFDQIISDSKSFEELRDSLKTIKSIVDQRDGVKNFLFALDFESFKKALGDFKQEQEKKENKQQSFWDFIKDKNYERNDIQKIVSVSNSLDEIKNNIKSLDDTLKIDQCKTCKQENKAGFWRLFTSIRKSISKIFSLFKNNGNQDVQDKQSLKYIASALNKDGDEGENARIVFYSMSKNMGLKEKGKLWEKISSYMKEKEEENKKPGRKKYEEEINTKTK